MDANDIAALCSAALLLVLLLLAVIGVYFYRRYLKSSSTKIPCSSQIIAPQITPKFVIPPYYNTDEKGGEGSDEKPVEAGNSDGEVSVPFVGRSLSMPSRAHSELVEATDEARASESGSVPRAYRPQYRRTVSSYVGTSTGPRKKVSIAPSGKLQVTLSFMATKNLLVIEVNGTFDMPQVRMCGISTPYVRVRLIQADKTKETRSAFMNLSCNRLCAFDRLTLEDAKNSSLSFIVLDYDRFSRSDFVAEVTLPLLDVDLEKGATLSLHLQSKTLEKCEERGSLVVSLCQQPAAGQLAVIVLKAERLPLTEDATAPDTYVKVTYYVQEKAVDKKKTKLVKQTTFPVFNEPFIFHMKEEDLRNSHIVCELFRADSARRIERIGHINLGLESFGSELRHWNEMMTSPQKQVAETHELRV